MKLIVFLARTSRWALVGAVVTSLLAGLANMGLLAVIGTAISNSESGAPLAWRFALLCALMLTFRLASQALLLRISTQAVYNLREHLARRVLAADLRHLEKAGSHRLLAALTDDIPVIANALFNIPLLCMHLAMVGGGLVYMGWLSWRVLVGVLIFLAVGIVTYQLPLMRGARYQQMSRDTSDTLYKHLRALIEGGKELKLHRRRRQAFLTEGLLKTADVMRRQVAVTNMIYAVAGGWGQVLIFILIGLVLFAVPPVVSVNAQTVAGYAIIILYMMAPLEVVLNLFPILSRANVSVHKIDELGLSLESFAREADAQPGAEGGLSFNRLEMRGVTHIYDHDKPESSFALGPLDLEFGPGELVFFIGGNGSGKTTFAKLLTGLYAPDEGEIRLDGRVVNDENRDFYRQHFATVFSDFFLFDSFLGLDTGHLDEKARDYLAKLELDHKVKITDGELSTTELSQGQRKRLALLTAYLEDRPVYIFDEWAADQDPVFRETFYYNILPSLKAQGKTALVISHDDRYYHVADRIIKLDYGKIEYDTRTHLVEGAAAEAARR
jgi:putative ATP-binding cassette transporter